MTTGRDHLRLPQPELVYSSGLNGNFVVGPLFVVVGGLIAVPISLYILSIPRNAAIPLILGLFYFLFGLFLSYVYYFRRPDRLEISNATLYWFLPFHRLKGQAAIADIDTIWTEQGLRWRSTRTVIVLRDGRAMKVTDASGINAFVAALAAISPAIYLEDWEGQRRFDTFEPIGSFHRKNDA